VIHAHSPVYNGFAALRVARENNIPCVYEMRAVWEDAAVDRQKFGARSVAYWIARLAEGRLLNSVDAVITICEGLQSEVINRGIAATKVTVVPNAIPRVTVQALGANDQLKRDLGWPDGPVFGFIGSLFHYEGVDRILDAVPAVLSKAPNVRFLVLGGGECEREIRERASQWRNNEVVFKPRVSHAEVAEYYSVTDCLVYPRRSIRLTELVTPLKPLEAMAMRRAVIASDIGGHRELIEHQRTGLLFDNREPLALQESISRLAQDQPLLQSLSASGQEFVSNERTWDRVGARYIPVYEGLLASRS
jgi:PEP-CTERM/exosortase A-associated glycosyltransferase